jgi:hypothetical protein
MSEFKKGDRVRYTGPGPYIEGTVVETIGHRNCTVDWGAAGRSAYGFHKLALVKPARVPLSEVKTAEEAEAWIGEEVEFHSAEGEGCGWYAEGRGRLSCWNPSPKWSSGVWYITGDTPQNVHRPAEFISPLTQEPAAVTPQPSPQLKKCPDCDKFCDMVRHQCKPKTAFADGGVVEFDGKEWIPVPSGYMPCDHCGAGEGEDHTVTCMDPFQVRLRVALEAKAIGLKGAENIKTIRYHEWLDELESLPYISPQELARIGRRR